MINKLNQIENFIGEISKKYPDLHIDYEYNKETDEYNIWHNDKNIETIDKEFWKFSSLKAEEMLFKNNIYNFYFGYDYYNSYQSFFRVMRININISIYF